MPSFIRRRLRRRGAASGSIDDVNAAIHLSKLLPNPHGILEWFFLLVLLGLLGAVTVFAGFLVVQQVRNPGRAIRRR
jgi:hypothetical protein